MDYKTDGTSLRRFYFKVGFDYLTPEGNVKFYDLFLKDLTEHSLNESSKKELEGIKNLAPGDFKVVRDRYSFYPKQDIDHWTLVKALQEEADLKDCPRNKRKIGYSSARSRSSMILWPRMKKILLAIASTGIMVLLSLGIF